MHPWGVSEHAVSKPINMQGAASRNQMNDILSPGSSESSGLYVKMVENVLASSPGASSLKYLTEAKNKAAKQNENLDGGHTSGATNGIDVNRGQDLTQSASDTGGVTSANTSAISIPNLNPSMVGGLNLMDNHPMAAPTAMFGNIPIPNASNESIGNFYSSDLTSSSLPGSVDSSIMDQYNQYFQQYALAQQQMYASSPIYVQPGSAGGPTGNTDPFSQPYIYGYQPFYSYANTGAGPWVYPTSTAMSTGGGNGTGFNGIQDNQQQNSGLNGQTTTTDSSAFRRGSNQSSSTITQSEQNTAAAGGLNPSNTAAIPQPLGATANANAGYFDQSNGSNALNNMGPPMYLGGGASAAPRNMQPMRMVTPQQQQLMNNANNFGGPGSPPTSMLHGQGGPAYSANPLLGNYNPYQPSTAPNPNQFSNMGNLTSGLAAMNLGQNPSGMNNTQRVDSLSGMKPPNAPNPPLPPYHPYNMAGMFNTSPPPSMWGPYANSPNMFGSPPTQGFYGPGPLALGPPGSGMFPTHPNAPIGMRPPIGRGGPRSGNLNPHRNHSQGPRSGFLDEYRAGHLQNLTLGEIQHHIIEFAQDQHGSRFIQQKLEKATPQEKEMVFKEMSTKLDEMMVDVFGNYVIQKFFEHGTKEQREELYKKLIGRTLQLSQKMYGCRVVQKALEQFSDANQQATPAEAEFILQLREKYQIPLVNELSGHVVECVKDQNGNHVIQKIIETCEAKDLQFIVDELQGNVYDLSIHSYGCRVIQRVLERCNEEQRKAILDELLKSTEQLVLDQFGNYVIQHVLEHGEPADKSKIIAEIKGRVLRYSQHKFASNVVEKCVSSANEQDKKDLISEVLADKNTILIMMKDQFANYVIQKMLDLADTDQKKRLMGGIQPHITSLRKYTYGKHITSKLEKYFYKNSDQNPDDESDTPT